MVKIVTIFLIAMLILGIFGKLRFPKLPRRGGENRIPTARKCPDCGAYMVGTGPCTCKSRG